MVRRCLAPDQLAAAVSRWAGQPVLVVGDTMLDEWRFAESDRLCREAPAPVLTLRHRQEAPGGAANAAVNLAALGARPTLVAPVGDDPAGARLRAGLTAAGVADGTLPQPGHTTPVKRRLLAADQILVREDESDPGGPLSEQAAALLLSTLDAISAHQPGSLLVICDYGLGALTEPVRRWLVAHRHRFGTAALDAHDLSPWQGLAPSVVTPSFAEAARILGRPPQAAPVGHADRRPDTATAWATELRDRTGAEVVAVTMDTAGAVVAGPEDPPHRTYADPLPASRAVGAGDVYLAAMALGLAADTPVPVAAEVAQVAATITVAQAGTCVCTAQALRGALEPKAAASGGFSAATGLSDSAAKVVDAAELAAIVRGRRDAGARIVFTNGCFDVLHRGHVGYLDQARRLGDLLIVAVNSDDSVRRLKGSDRPVNPVEDRVAVLAALSCVDHVVVFEQDSPAELIEAVRPDSYVKGGDYPPELVPEAPLVRRLGGTVETVTYVADRSTSAIIDQIRARGPASARAACTTESDNSGPFLSAGGAG